MNIINIIWLIFIYVSCMYNLFFSFSAWFKEQNIKNKQNKHFWTFLILFKRFSDNKLIRKERITVNFTI